MSRFLSLGPAPLANAFLSPSEFQDERAYPLDVYLCHHCGLVQLVDVIDRSTLFSRYIYTSGTSETVRTHNRRLAATVHDLLALRPSDLVVEVASNDGSLLSCFKQLGTRVLGVEPAANLAAVSTAQGLDTVNVFFDFAVAQRLRQDQGPAKAIIANNVLAHVDDPGDFLRGCAALLDPEGLLIAEVPSLRELIEHKEYDTVYHEHLSYFSATALVRLCDEAGMSLVRIDHIPIHGGSLRMFAAPRRHDHGGEVLQLAREEQADGLTELPRFERFASDVAQHRAAIISLLDGITATGKTIAGYGAAAKGNTLLNYCGIDHRRLRYIVDRNTLKIGLYTPGTHVPVVSAERLNTDPPDYLLILAWNVAEEVMAQQREYRERGGRFIVPIPTPQAA